MNTPRRLPTRLCFALAALPTLGLALAQDAQAETLYGNFDPLAGISTPGPVDYSSSDYADISGYCGYSTCAGFFNLQSAGFSFQAQASGSITHAYLPLHAISSFSGAERFYRITITDSAGGVVAQGGLLGRDVPLGKMAVYEFALDRVIEAGQTLAPSGELVAGETYHAYFHQRFGALASTHWMSSHVVPEPGQAYQRCANNTGTAVCAYNYGQGWVYPYGNAYTMPIDDFLPALTLTDGGGPTPAVPEPGSAALLLAGLAAAAGVAARRRRPAGG